MASFAPNAYVRKSVVSAILPPSSSFPRLFAVTTINLAAYAAGHAQTCMWLNARGVCSWHPLGTSTLRHLGENPLRSVFTILLVLALLALGTTKTHTSQVVSRKS
jgi:hypothetical protein